MTAIWPWLPVDQVIEALEWKTDVIGAIQQEQRIALRSRPRRTWEYAHVFTQEQYSAARAIVRSGEVLLPDWLRGPVYSGPVSAGASVVLTVDTTDIEAEPGDRLLYTYAPGRWAAVTVEAISPATITLETVTHGVTVASLYLACVARPGMALQAQRSAGRVALAQVSFECSGRADFSASTYPQYRGHDVMTDIPVVGDGQLDEVAALQVESFDNLTGAVSVSSMRKYGTQTTAMRWHVLGKDKERALRRWLASRAGRLKAFWRTTWARDFTAAAGISDSGTALHVYLPEGAESLPVTAFDIEIHGLALYRRRVSSVTPSADINGRPTALLSIDAPLGAAHTVGQIGRISYLQCLRFDADRIELLHRPRAGMAVAVPCIEVPVP